MLYDGIVSRMIKLGLRHHDSTRHLHPWGERGKPMTAVSCAFIGFFTGLFTTVMISVYTKV